MSPTNTPRATFNPLPPELPREEEESKKDKKSKKDKTTPKEKPYVKTHKHGVSWDDSAYGSSSPYSYEDRSPDQYPRSSKFGTDEVKYEVINGKTRKVKYYTKNGKRYRYVSSTLDSADDDEYVRDPSYDPYKDKYKDVKRQAKILTEVVAEAEETAKYNYQAAKREESAKFAAAATIEELESRLRALTLQAQVAEIRMAEEQRKRAAIERKLEEKELNDELERRRELLQIKEKRLAREQWEQIEASPSPVDRKRRSYPVVTQPANRPRTTTAPGTVTTTTYGQNTVSAYKSPLAPTDPYDAIREAQADYDAGRSKPSRRSDEDRRYATGTQTGYTSQRTPARRDEYRR